MNNTPNKLRRRDFLTGAATALGSGIIAGIPAIAAAQMKSGPVAQGPSLLAWNGTHFVPAEHSSPGIINGESISVRIESFGTNSNISAIDVQMPGGLFHAFTSPPKGQKVAQFRSPVSPTLGLTLLVTAGSSQHTFALRAGATAGPKLAPGTYMLADATLPTADVVLTESKESRVVHSDGLPLLAPYTLITVTE